jgi:hypothetical protein
MIAGCRGVGGDVYRLMLSGSSKKKSSIGLLTAGDLPKYGSVSHLFRGVLVLLPVPQQQRFFFPLDIY